MSALLFSLLNGIPTKLPSECDDYFYRPKVFCVASCFCIAYIFVPLFDAMLHTFTASFSSILYVICGF